MANVRDVYMNPKQQQIFYANPRILYLLGSRRFGKTDGCIGPRIYRVQQALPGSTNAILGSSRAQLLRRTVPGMIAAIERFFRIKEGRHFGFGKPPKWVPKPIQTPRSWESSLWFANGAYFQMISLATIGSANGLSLCSLIGDETKFFPWAKIQGEVLPALSGQTHPFNSEAFSDFNPLYKSVMFASDASLTAKGNWLEKLESILEEEIENGEFKGKTYGWLQAQLVEYADFVRKYNEASRECRLANGKRIVCTSEEIADVRRLAEMMMAHEGKFRIMPNHGRHITKGMCEMAVNYKLITPEEAELVYNWQWLVTPRDDLRMMAITDRDENRYKRMIRTMQRDARCFFRANTIDNIALLGEAYLKDMKRTLAPLVYQISILNEKGKKLNDGFYSSLDIEGKHGYIGDVDVLNMPGVNVIKTSSHIIGGTEYREEYESVNFDALTSVDDCSLNGDVDPNKPLYIAFDYGSLINWVVTGQMYQRDGKECLNVTSSHFVKNGLLLQDLVAKWSDYHKPHQKTNREVIYFYDHTAKFKNYAISKTDFKDIVIAELTRRGWQVTDVFIGQAMVHTEKYQIINEGLAEISFPAIRFNQETNESLIIAMENAGVIKVGKEYKKYKAGEKLSEDSANAEPLELRTDGTDAFDTLYIGVKFHRGSGGWFLRPNGR